jgi:hypothetical protein
MSRRIDQFTIKTTASAPIAGSRAASIMTRGPALGKSPPDHQRRKKKK